MDINKEIEEHINTMAEFITQKTYYRSELSLVEAKIRVLSSQYLPKSSASFENKIQLLMGIPEIKKRMIKLNYDYSKLETKWKNARDFYDLYSRKVMELQALRKNLSNGL